MIVYLSGCSHDDGATSSLSRIASHASGHSTQKGAAKFALTVDNPRLLVDQPTVAFNGGLSVKKTYEKPVLVKRERLSVVTAAIASSRFT